MLSNFLKVNRKLSILKHLNTPELYLNLFQTY